MTITSKITIMLLLACTMAISVQERRVRTARAREAAAALATTNAIAERDSTRDLARENARVARLVGDSIRIVEKHVVQVEAKNDALDRALGGERKAKFQLFARVDSLRRIATAAIREDSGVRRASFAVRQAPYTIDADVAMPAPPDPGRIALSVALDPMAIEARIRCEKPDEHGVRAASLVVSGPTWASVRLERLEQSAEVCAPERSRAAHGSLFALAPVIGLGAVRGERPGTRIGFFFGLGLRIWR